jgi:hypothetical protein
LAKQKLILRGTSQVARVWFTGNGGQINWTDQPSLSELNINQLNINQLNIGQLNISQLNVS